MASNFQPPPLPPRLSSEISSPASTPFLLSPNNISLALHSTDPRTSSTQSLVPSISESETRRKLLLVYIHGFYGNDQSFRSFPSHVHTLLGSLLEETHAIHSKIYPRYKTYKAIEVARDNFSTWLEPHESPETDVILVGHSMGGLLAAEVILMPNRNPYKQQPFKHRILGTIAMDSPFLGLHPGIVVSGIASLFQPSPKLEDVHQQHGGVQQELGSMSTIDRLPSTSSGADSIYTESSSPTSLSRQSTDPYFDPPYYNDTPFREKPFVKRLMNFTAKHRREGLINAVGNHISSHLEFGGCLADYRGLRIRYNKLRALEDIDEIQLMADGHPAGAYGRVRFVNYYTLSPGRPKPPKPEMEESKESAEIPQNADESQQAEPSEVEDSPEVMYNTSCMESEIPANQPKENAGPGESSAASKATTEPARNDDKKSDQDTSKDAVENINQAHLMSTDEDSAAHPLPNISQLSMQNLDPIPLAEHTPEPCKAQTQTISDGIDLPPIPEPPEKPILPDLDQLTDKDAKKQAEKESRRLQKAYDQTIKDRNKAIQEREKLIEKRRKKVLKEAEKKVKDEGKESIKREKEEKKRVSRDEAEATRQAARAASASMISDTAAQDAETGKKKKLKKFCAVPSKKNGVRDSTWPDVYMEGMDEVGAHCGLFLSGPHYDKLVGDVGMRIAGWVHEDLTKRAILNAS
ncbi:hypothetical protein QQS21_004056 [Conoideocrella luteorostrata]|uniref:DUF676 domain-containing protein n=1 Tax=Conoideocrella luteorostrata TaxID=1105319 RepID=A0AAJ0CS49_9HYPO|nr:hypothetical protein QQS21_004056 [Conoideocrella luteorostrata]